MSIRFSGGDRFQRGRGIGGILRIAKSLFQPIIGTIGRAVKSNTGKAIGKAIKEQVIESGVNLAADALRGNNLNEGLNREVKSFKERGAEGLEQLQQSRRRKKEPEKSENSTYIFVDKVSKKKRNKKKC